MKIDQGWNEREVGLKRSEEGLKKNSKKKGFFFFPTLQFI